MNDQMDLDIAMEVLGNVGLAVSRVSESKVPNVRRCDIMASDDTATYWVEVKALHEDESLIEQLQNGEFAKRSKPVDYSEPAAGSIKDAIGQIRQTRADVADGFSVVLLINRCGLNARITDEQVPATVFGAVPILIHSADKSDSTPQCLYFGESIFHRYKELCAVLFVDSASNICLLVNDYAHGASALRATSMFKRFNDCGGANSAEILEDNGFLWADFAGDRSDEKAMLAALSQKYGVDAVCAVKLRQNSVSAMLRPHSDHR